jgi:hypothetical protein
VIVPHELERVDEVDEEQLTKQEWEEEQRQQQWRRRVWRAELGQPRTPEPMGLGMTHHHNASLDEDNVSSVHSTNDLLSQNPSIFDHLFQRLNTLSTKFESVVKLSSTLQVQHEAAQSTILALESKVMTLESCRIPTQNTLPGILTRICIPSIPRLPGIPHRYTKRLEKIS